MNTFKEKWKQKYFKPFFFFFIFALILNCFIFIQSAMPGNISKAESDSIGGVIGGIINTESDQEFNRLIRKLLGHFSLFGLSGILSSSALIFYFKNTSIFNYKKLILISGGIGLFSSLFSEFLQLVTPGRFFALSDVGINFIGYLLGLLVVVLVQFLIDKKKTYH